VLRTVEIPENVRNEVWNLLNHEQDILNAVKLRLKEPLYCERTRIHGDLSLEQIAEVTPEQQLARDRERERDYDDHDDGELPSAEECYRKTEKRKFLIFDFSGDNTRPLSERRLKQSPLKDVAVLLESMWYATQSVIKGLSRNTVCEYERDKDEIDLDLPNIGADVLDAQKSKELDKEKEMAQFVDKWAEIWHRLMCEEFLTIYRRKVLSQSQIGMVPPSPSPSPPPSSSSSTTAPSTLSLPRSEAPPPSLVGAPPAITMGSPNALVPIMLPDFIRFLEVFTIEKSVREMYWAVVHRPSWLGIPASVLTHLCLHDKPRYAASHK